MKPRTYHYEQSVLLVLVLLAATLQIHALEIAHQLTPWTLCVVFASSILVMLTQQVRSMANRQKEQNDATGVRNAWMECSPKVASRALATQIIGTVLGFAQAPTWAHVLIILFAVGYEPIWRRWYRKHYPVSLSVSVEVEGLKLDGALADMVIFVRGKNATVIKDKTGVIGNDASDEIPLEELIARLMERR